MSPLTPLSTAPTSSPSLPSQPTSPIAMSTRPTPRHHRRTSSVVSKPLSPLSPLSPTTFNAPNDIYRDTHDHSPPSTPHRSSSSRAHSRNTSRHRRASSATSAISNYTLDAIAPRSPNPLSRDKPLVHAFDRTLLTQWHVDASLWQRLPPTVQCALSRLQERGAAVEEARARCASLWAEAGSRGWPQGWDDGTAGADGGFDEISWHFYAAECRSFLQAARADAIGLLHAASRVVSEAVEQGKVGTVDMDREALRELEAWMVQVGTPRAEELKGVVDALECPNVADVQVEVMGLAGGTLETGKACDCAKDAWPSRFVGRRE